MGRPLSQRGIRHDNRCCQGFSTRQEPACATCGSALPEYPSLISKLFRHVVSLADIARQLRFLAAACFPLRRTPL